MATNTRHDPELVPQTALWFGLLAGPIAWSLRLLIGYPLVSVACEQGATYLLHLVSAIFLLVTLAGGAVAWWSYRRIRRGDRREEHDTDDWTLERTRFMVLLSLLMSGLFALVILAEWTPVFFTDPCIVS
jgi:amino acid transporter